MAAKAREIQNAAGGERVERTAGIGHGDGDDGGEEKSGEAGGHFAHEEERKDAIGAFTGGEKRRVLRENKEQNADEKENRELNEDDDAAGEKSAAAVAFVARGEKALDDGLIGSVAGHGEESATDEAGPKCVFRGEVEREIEELQFVAGGSGDLRDFGPAARNAMEQYPERDGAAGEIEEELRDVCPDDGGHAAFESVKNGERDDDDDGEVLGRTENDADDERDGGYANTLRNGARNEKRAGGDGAHFFAKAFFDERVGGEELSAEVAGEEKQNDENAAYQIPDDELNEGEISAVGDGGRADDGERGGFGGDDGERESPPGSGAAAEEVVERDGVAIVFVSGDVFFCAAKAHAERGDGEEITDNDGEVERMDAH